MSLRCLGLPQVLGAHETFQGEYRDASIGFNDWAADAIGCSSKDDDATDTGTAGGGGGTDECGTPQATADFDEVDFYVRGTVDFKFTKDKDEEATVSLPTLCSSHRKE